jgi:hypothetical protein
MGGFFIRPKSSTRDNAQGMNHVEAIGVVQSYEDEYMETTGHDPGNVNSGAIHRRGPARPGPGNLGPVKGVK